MILYNIHKDRIADVITIQSEGNTIELELLTDAERNVYGYYKVGSTGNMQDDRYYINTEVNSVVGNKYTTRYTYVEKELEDVKELIKADMINAYDGYLLKPRVDTTLGYDVWGSLESVEELRMWKDYSYTEIVDADEQLQEVTGVSYSTIAIAIKDYRRMVYDVRKTKAFDLSEFTTVAECIAYENEPYVVDGITYYRNNTIDWQI